MTKRRDFSEFNAKLEKHIERLPDYAQRAQEKLQRYFPPADEAGGKPQQNSRAPRGPVSPPPVPRRPSAPAAFSAVAGQVPAVAEVRAKWQRWNEPSAKHQRRIRRTSRVLTLWVLVTILFGVLTVLTATGLLGGAVSQARRSGRRCSPVSRRWCSARSASAPECGCES